VISVFELCPARFGTRALRVDVLLQGLPVGETVAEILDGPRQRTDLVLAFTSGHGDRQISGAEAMDGFRQLRQGAVTRATST
jgi:hypothetical protein